MNLEKKIVSIISICILTMAMFIAVSSAVDSNISDEPEASRVEVDFEDLYPHENQTIEETDALDVIEGYIESINGVVDRVKDFIESYATLDDAPKEALSYLYGKINYVLNRNVFEDIETNIYRLKNGYMTCYGVEPVENIDKKAADAKAISDYLASKGIAFINVMTADTLVEEQGQLQPWMNDDFMSTTNKMIESFERDNVDYLNCYDVLRNSDRDYYDWFFKSDHHWKNECGLYITKHISKKLNEEYGFRINEDLYNEDQYRVETYEDWFLGSYGKKTSLGYVSPDDFSIYYPAFETKFHINIPNIGLDSVGDYNVLIDKTKLRKDYYNENNYAAFLYADKPLINVENLLADNDYRILVVKKSKANVITPHLACGVKYLDIIDLRHFPGSIGSFIEQTNPDVVMVIDSAIGCDFSEWDIG